MAKKYHGDMDFMNKLDKEDRERFLAQPKEVQERAVTENKLAKEEQKLWEENAGVSQLADRLASKSFQG
ncbi:MAG: hypothetical protein K2K70_14640 [Lachnospiraceae bacterium]|nr:hypothetical protein [Lachnospiraceae bacterium]